MLLSEYYRGFCIDQPVGNNAFSFNQRRNKSIYVPPLITGTLAELAPGEKIAFSEISDGREINACGLKKFLHLSFAGKDVVIFDNHNHAFFFWCWGIKSGKIPAAGVLLHVDQHKDTRPPPRTTPFSGPAAIDLAQAFDYTNYVLNVGNFIPPAVNSGIFSKVINVDSRETFALDFPGNFALDIDLDIFAEEMNYIPREIKIARLREWIRRSEFITVATSPFFMAQEEALAIIRELLI